MKPSTPDPRYDSAAMVHKSYCLPCLVAWNCAGTNSLPHRLFFHPVWICARGILAFYRERVLVREVGGEKVAEERNGDRRGMEMVGFEGGMDGCRCALQWGFARRHTSWVV